MKKKFFRLNPAEEKATSIFEQKSILDGIFSDKEEQIRKAYSESCPIEEIQRYIVNTNNILAISVISEEWDFDADVLKSLIRKATAEAREAYTANRKFFKVLEVEYAKSGQLSELKIYFSRYKKEMDKKACNICIDVRGIDPSLDCIEKKKTARGTVVAEAKKSPLECTAKVTVHSLERLENSKGEKKSLGQVGRDGIFYM